MQEHLGDWSNPERAAPSVVRVPASRACFTRLAALKIVPDSGEPELGGQNNRLRYENIY